MSEERKLKDDEKGRLCTLKYYKKLKHRNETMKNINYAIFDMDGTLLDSMHIWDTASGAFLMMRGIIPKEFDLFRKQGYRTGISYMIKEYNLNMSFDEVLDGLQEILWFYYSNIAPIKDGVKDFLQSLKDNGVKMVVATATESGMAKKALERNGILGYFEDVISMHEIGIHKNDPAAFEYVKNAIHAEGVGYVFEDALYAIKTAKSAGYKVIGIEDYSNEDDRNEIKKTVDFYAENYDRVKEYFKK